MRTQLVNKSCLVLFFLFVILTASSPQKTVTLQEKTIENNVRLNQLEKELEIQHKEMQVDIDNRFVDLEERLKLKSDNVEYKKELVGWWLTVLSILITVFGVIIPIGGFIYGRRFIKDTDNELKTLKNESKNIISQFINDSKERIILLEEKAQAYISNLHKYEQAGKDAANRISDIEKALNGLSENIANTELTVKDKKEFVTKAQELGNEKGISEYEKDYAKALELVYSSKYQFALDKFMDILKKYPLSININRLCDIYNNIGFLYDKLKETDKAIEYFRKTISIKPEYAFAWNNLGITLANIEKEEEAIECFKKAISEKPDYPSAMYNLGCSYGNLMDFENAKIYYKKVIDTGSKESTSSHLNLIEILLFEHQLEEAENYLRKAKIIDDKDFSVNLLDLILSIFLNNFNGVLHDSFEMLKLLPNTDPSNTKWTFDLFNRWLLIDSSQFLTIKQRALLMELISLYDSWKK